MINVKPIIYKELQKIADNVTDTYPEDWESYPVVIYLEEQNKPYEVYDGKEQKAEIRYKIDIFDVGSTSATAVAIDAVFMSLGMRRTQSVDTPDPGHLKHKVMRFEGVVDLNSELVYQARMEG